MFDVSVDQLFMRTEGQGQALAESTLMCYLNSMNEKELVVIEATAEGIKKARETEVPE